MSEATYTVAVGRSWHADGTMAPDRTCRHKHRSLEAAEKCGRKLYGAGYIRGQWRANAKWHAYYILDNSTGRKAGH